MSTKTKRSGGKYTGNHTTITPTAGIICDIVDADPKVTKISLGIIKPVSSTSNGARRIKITDKTREILIAIRENVGVQEIHVYSDDPQASMENVARQARDQNIAVSFGTKVPV